MKEKRRAKRAVIELDAKYSLDNSHQKKDCKVIDISRYGAKVVLNLEEEMGIGENIFLEIHSPNKAETVTSLVNLSWIQALGEKSMFGYAAGGRIKHIKITENDDACKFWDYAFDYWWRKHQTDNTSAME